MPVKTLAKSFLSKFIKIFVKTFFIGNNNNDDNNNNRGTNDGRTKSKQDGPFCDH